MAKERTMARKQRLPYGARSSEEMQRNLARLGTRWQVNPTPERPRSHAASWWEGFFWGWFWGSWR
jgi:hypothetical protein